MAEPPKTLTCPRCSTVNQLADDTCRECALPLAAIRAALADATADGPSATSAAIALEPPDGAGDVASESPSADGSPTASPGRFADRAPGELVRTEQRLVRRGADREEAIVRSFAEAMEGSGISGLDMSTGQLSYSQNGRTTDTRDCYFVQRDLGGEAFSTVAISMVPLGRDLQIEWRSFDAPPPDTRKPWGVILGVAGFLVITLLGLNNLGPFALFFGFMVGVGMFRLGLWIQSMQRPPTLSEFQRHDSRAFHRAVEDALLEAIRDAGMDRR